MSILDLASKLRGAAITYENPITCLALSRDVEFCKKTYSEVAIDNAHARHQIRCAAMVDEPGFVALS